MCGIGGVLFHRDVDGGPRRGRPPPRVAERLIAALRHRGPDGEGVFVDDGTLLVHTRLAIVDVAHGQQPLLSPDGRFALVINGEIYNHAALRPRLERHGAVFRTRSDAEALLWTLIVDGAAGLDDVEGEFAFCFWDARARQALLGRDTLGVKPLVFLEDDGALWFASEVKALLAVCPHRRVVDVDAAVAAFVAPAFSGERVPFVGVHTVPAGGVIAVDAHGHRVLRRHRFRAATTTTERPEALAAALEAAVRDRLMGDVPIGAFISGGVDSSAIMHAARSSSSSSSSLPCFTIRFEHHDGDGRAPIASGSIVVGDDAVFVEQLAKDWALAVTRVRASRAALVDDLAALIASQDRIVAWEQELSQRFLARAAAVDVKAVLVGDAADETHFGYAFALGDDSSRSARALLERFGRSKRSALLAPHLRDRASAVVDEIAAIAADAGTPFDGAPSQRRLATTSVLLERWLPRLLHNGDLHTMTFGLEARVPFADRRVLAVAAGVGIDEGFVVDDAVPEKHFLRRAVAPWLPPAVIARRKSALPRDDGIGAVWRDLVRGLDLEPVSPWLDPDAVSALAARDDAVDDTSRALLFSVITFAGFVAHHGS